jgi:hypothetical protein
MLKRFITKLLFFIPLATILFFLSCKKEEEENLTDKLIINYPSMGIYGENIIGLDSLIIKGDGWGQKNNVYSIKAELPEGTSLKLKFVNKSIGNAVWAFNRSSCVNWSIDTYENNEQIFNAYGQAICDMNIHFYDTGYAEIYIYENGVETPTRVKKISW